MTAKALGVEMALGKRLPVLLRNMGLCAVLAGSTASAQNAQVQSLELSPAPRVKVYPDESSVGIANFSDQVFTLESIAITGVDEEVSLRVAGNSVASVVVQAGMVTTVDFSSEAFVPGSEGQLEFRLLGPAASDSTVGSSSRRPYLLLRSFSVPPTRRLDERLGIVLAALAAIVAVGATARYARKKYDLELGEAFISEGPVSIGKSWSVWFTAIVGAGTTAILPALSSVFGSDSSGPNQALALLGALLAVPFLIAPLIIFTRKPTQDELREATGLLHDPYGLYVAVVMGRFLGAQFLALFSAFGETFLVASWLELGTRSLGWSEGPTTVLLWGLVVTVWGVAIYYVFRVLRGIIDASVRPVALKRVKLAESAGDRPATALPRSRNVVRLRLA